MHKPIAARPWYRFANAVAEGDVAADLYVYDYIGESWDGESVTAKRFVAEVNALPKSVASLNVHINSPGGSVFDAVAIANVLRAHKATVNVAIDGLAASAATIVAMGGDKIRIADNALFMIHDPVGFSIGGAKDMRKMADALETARDAIVATYRWHSPLEPAAIADLMSETTWMGAAEAVERGFAHETTAPTAAQAQLDEDVAAVLGTVPERYRAAFQALTTVKVPVEPIASPPPVEAMSPAFAKEPATERGATMTDEEMQAEIGKAKIEGYEEGRTAERERILGVEGALIQGHEKLVAELKRDPAVTPGEAALRVNAAERAGRDRALAAIRNDGKATEGAVTATVTNAGGEVGLTDDPRRPLEERAKVVWDNSPDLRDEYDKMGGFESYLSWRKAEANGTARILKAVK